MKFGSFLVSGAWLVLISTRGLVRGRRQVLQVLRQRERIHEFRVSLCVFCVGLTFWVGLFFYSCFGGPNVTVCFVCFLASTFLCMVCL